MTTTSHTPAVLDKLPRPYQLAFLGALYVPKGTDDGIVYSEGDAYVNFKGHGVIIGVQTNPDAAIYSLALYPDSRVRRVKGNKVLPQAVKNRSWVQVEEATDKHGNAITSIRLTNEGKRMRYRLADLCDTAAVKMQAKVWVIGEGSPA